MQIFFTKYHIQVRQLIFAQERPGDECSRACSSRTPCATFPRSLATAKRFLIISDTVNRILEFPTEIPTPTEIQIPSCSGNSKHFVRSASKSLPAVLGTRARDQLDRMQQFGEDGRQVKTTQCCTRGAASRAV